MATVPQTISGRPEARGRSGVEEVNVLDRYLSAQMAAVFSDQARFEYWRQVEIAVLAGYAHLGAIDQGVVDAAGRVPCPSAEAVNQRERQTGHDVVAFLIEWTSGMPDEVSSRVARLDELGRGRHGARAGVARR